jgi:hypothetical protein
MESFIGAIVFVIQLVAAGFMMWGGWLVFRDWFRHDPAAAAAAETAPPQAEVQSFERVASLVLFALLCTTLAAAA